MIHVNVFSWWKLMNVVKAICGTTRSSATAERQCVSYACLFVGSLTDRALHWTPHLLYNYRLAKVISTLSANKPCDIHGECFQTFDAPAKRNPCGLRVSAYTLYFQKLETLDYIFCPCMHVPEFIQICAVDSKRCIFSAPDCVLAVQGHPWSMILVPIESAYTTSY